jgi:hypothetical protein
MRDFKITTILGNIYIYPFPVMKESKYLISCDSLQQAQELIDKISKKQIKHPDDEGANILFISLHTDQQTKIFKLI